MSDDLISRQAAIDAVRKLCDGCDNGGWCGECRIDYPDKDVINVLESLPPVQPDAEPHWIKCSEKMPDYGIEVIVCDATYGNVFNAIRCRKREEQGDSWFTDCDYINYKAFTHWMPMPEPPKEEI